MDQGLKRLIEKVEEEGERYSIPIPRDSLMSWMAHGDLESLGAVHALLARKNVREQISPPLEIRDYFQFNKAYLLRCLMENVRGEWANSRYEAGWELCRWFVQLWHDPTVDRMFLSELKNRLAEIYQHADPELRHAIETAVLEHLFEDSQIAEFFADWKHREPLSAAFRAAALWVERGGKSPLHDR